MERSRLLLAEVFQGMSGPCVKGLMEVAEARTLESGETLFRLGDEATRFYVVGSGQIELTLPVSPDEGRELRIETRGPGATVGWSALIPPYRFTLSARAGEPSEVFGWTRATLDSAFEEDPRSGLLFMKHVCAGIGRRLVHMQAMWARELRHSVERDVG